ncbi:hypothetical protein MNBD_CHLOROFLEXI01-2875 [hydrothermal vent metagenome]|uniref:Uncharacterized protein n=1 Tax=hydrothermal vent metagenome TaxID=652676 RepID=A0A3B0VWF4_9ZZZZ
MRLALRKASGRFFNDNLMSEIILPTDSNIYTAFQKIAGQQRLVFFAGLPGTGKSLLIQQLAVIAQQAGRTVHLLQWDVTRGAFETAVILQKYPEIDGSTHPAIRKAVGLWAREAVYRWANSHDDSHLLIGEVPLIGNRLSELSQPYNDAAEAVLSSPDCLFVIPAPNQAVRQVIETARARTIANPRHEKERKDAQPNVLQLLWQQIAEIGAELGLTNRKLGKNVAYDPKVYTAVYQHLLQHRHHQTLPIDTVLTPNGSAYALQINGTELAATPSEVAAIMQKIEKKYTGDGLETAVANWYKT